MLLQQKILTMVNGLMIGLNWFDSNQFSWFELDDRFNWSGQMSMRYWVVLSVLLIVSSALDFSSMIKNFVDYILFSYALCFSLPPLVKLSHDTSLVSSLGSTTWGWGHIKLQTLSC